MAIYLTGATGLAATSAGATAAISAGVGGFVGSAVSQVVGKGLGVVESFSLRQAVGAGLTAGLGSAAGTAISGSSALQPAVLEGSKVIQEAGKFAYLNTAARAVSSFAASQIGSRAAGLDTSFSWRGLAAQVVAAQVTKPVLKDLEATKAMGFAERLVRGTVSGFVAAGAAGYLNRQWNRGGKVDLAYIAADAFGNALGNGVVDEAGKSSTSPKVNNQEYTEDDYAALYTRFRQEGLSSAEADQLAEYAIYGDIKTSDGDIQASVSADAIIASQGGMLDVFGSREELAQMIAMNGGNLPAEFVGTNSVKLEDIFPEYTDVLGEMLAGWTADDSYEFAQSQLENNVGLFTEIVKKDSVLQEYLGFLNDETVGYQSLPGNANDIRIGTSDVLRALAQLGDKGAALYVNFTDDGSKLDAIFKDSEGVLHQYQSIQNGGVIDVEKEYARRATNYFIGVTPENGKNGLPAVSFAWGAEYVGLEDLEPTAVSHATQNHARSAGSIKVPYKEALWKSASSVSNFKWNALAPAGTALEYGFHTFGTDIFGENLDKNWHEQGLSGFGVDMVMDLQKGVLAGVLGTMAAGMVHGAIAGSALPGAGTIVGATAGATAGLITSIGVSAGIEFLYTRAGSRDYFKEAVKTQSGNLTHEQLQERLDRLRYVK